MTKKNILITGSKGFIGKNLIKALDQYNIYEFHRQSSWDELNKYIDKIDFIFHLAGEVRPNSTKDEFEKANIGVTKQLIDTIEKNNLKIPILVTSSKHANNPKNDYGVSKQIADELLIEYAKKTNTNVYIFRLPHIFGEGCKPNHNSAITTWIYSSINNLPIIIYDRDIKMEYTYVKDFTKDAVGYIDNSKNEVFNDVTTLYKTTLGQVYDCLVNFKKYNKALTNNEFEKKLYKVYTHYKEHK